MRQIEDGCLHPDEAAQVFGLARSTVFKPSACREGGEDALRAKPGPGSPLEAHHRLIVGGNPCQLRSDFDLWTHDRFGK
ncbi:hypothetical protein [Streptomyces sp. SD15]